MRNTDSQTLLMAKIRLGRYIVSFVACLIIILFPPYQGYQSHWVFLPLLGMAVAFIFVERQFMPVNAQETKQSVLQVLGISNKTERVLKIAQAVIGVVMLIWLVASFFPNYLSF